MFIANLKRITAVMLAVLLACPNISLATVGNTAASKTQDDVKVLLTTPDKYKKSKNYGEYLFWSTAVVASGFCGYKIGKVVGHVHGFGNGINMSGAQELKALTGQQQAKLMQVEKQLLKLQKQLVKTNASSAEDQAIQLIIRLNSQISGLKGLRRYEEESAKKSISKTIDKLYALELKNVSTRRMMGKFLDQASKSLGKKGTMWAIASILPASIACILLLNEEERTPISNNRLAVQRQLQTAYAAGAQVFALKAISLKNKYGLELVSSVIYENRAKFYPVLSEQIAMFANRDNRLVADAMLGSAKQSSGYSFKYNLVKSLKNPQMPNYLKTF